MVFRGGKWGSAVPLTVFLAFTMGLVVAGAPKEEGMIIGAMIGLSAGMLFVTDLAAYSERIFTLMANRTATGNSTASSSTQPNDPRRER